MQALLLLGQDKMTGQQLGQQLCQTSYMTGELASHITTSSHFPSSTKERTGNQQVSSGVEGRASIMLEGAL